MEEKVEAQLLGLVRIAWKRWHNRIHHSSNGSQRSVKLNNFDGVDINIQYELMAISLYATISTDMQQTLYTLNLNEFIQINNNTANEPSDETIGIFHLLLTLVCEHLNSALLTDKDIKQYLCVIMNVLSILQQKQYVSQYFVCLKIIRLYLHHCAVNNAMHIVDISHQVSSRLQSAKTKLLESNINDAIRHSNEMLCSVLSECLIVAKSSNTSMTTFLTSTYLEVVNHVKSVVEFSITSGSPNILLAVSTQLLEIYIEENKREGLTSYLSVSRSKEVFDLIINTRAQSGGNPYFLDLLCVIVCLNPSIAAETVGIEEFITDALSNADPKRRKQGLYLFEAIYSWMITTTTNESTSTTDLSIWQNFLVASQVVHMHHEQHLIDQVWPQIHDLLYKIMGTEIKNTPSIFTFNFSFQWLESLLLRILFHTNPIVRRNILTKFMSTCVDIWNTTPQRQTTIETASNITLIGLEDFIFQQLLPACNDPILYKKSNASQEFQKQLVSFLASFIFFTCQRSIQKKGLLIRYTDAIYKAFCATSSNDIGGQRNSRKSRKKHCPNALVAYFKVFEDPNLKLFVQESENCEEIVLTGEALEKLRYLVDVIAIQSYPTVIVLDILNSLECAMIYFSIPFKGKISLKLIANLLLIFNCGDISMDSARYSRLYLWAHSISQHSKKIEEISLVQDHGFVAKAFEAVEEYLFQPQSATDSESFSWSAETLAILLLFTACITKSNYTCASHNPSDFFTFRLDGIYQDTQMINKQLDNINLKYLYKLLSQLEIRMESSPVVDYIYRSKKNAKDKLLNHCILFNPISFYSRLTYSFAGSIETDFDGCSWIFGNAIKYVDSWFDANFELSKDDVRFQYHDEVVQSLGDSTFLASQMAMHLMFGPKDHANMGPMNLLSTFALKLQNRAQETNEYSYFTIVIFILSKITDCSQVVEALDDFKPDKLIPMVLDHVPPLTSIAKELIPLHSFSKWRLVSRVLEMSSYYSKNITQVTFDACIKALPSIGNDPEGLSDIIRALKCTIQHGALAKNNLENAENMLQSIWNAYRSCTTKSDDLTQVVLYCMLQPEFMTDDESYSQPVEVNSQHSKSSLLGIVKGWINRIMEFGASHRPNVILHLVVRLCAIWRTFPSLVDSFVNEWVEFLLYKEPVLSEKEALFISTSIPEIEGKSNLIRAKNKIVRFVMMSCLEDLLIYCHSPQIQYNNYCQELSGFFTKLTLELLKRTTLPSWRKQHMLNSDGFGLKLRCWQALCILSSHISDSTSNEVTSILFTTFGDPQLPPVRYYMELFAIRLAAKFPTLVFTDHILPLLRKPNLLPQVAASLSFVSAVLLNQQWRLPPSQSNFPNEIYSNVVMDIIPWLNCSHGQTRVLVQFLLTVLLPPLIESHTSNSMSQAIVQNITMFLSENKECKKMYNRQVMQLQTVADEVLSTTQLSVSRILLEGKLNECNEVFPADALCFNSEIFKNTMNELYDQYQREHFNSERTQMQSKNSNNAIQILREQFEGSAVPSSALVQRKINTSDFVSQSSRQEGNMRLRSKGTVGMESNVILCASLVDKVPNLAGLARTCEIFNVRKLVVPNLRICSESEGLFAKISVTANQWVSMDEVIPEKLREALLQWKSMGYTIIALEQTSESVCLSTYTFPTKAVFVLGREKEGIPVDILHVVDVCVEIPQFGVIRSLNVHVSGALLLWEYTQQQMLKASKGTECR